MSNIGNTEISNNQHNEKKKNKNILNQSWQKFTDSHFSEFCVLLSFIINIPMCRSGGVF